MKIRHIPMSTEDFHLLPFHPGWKVELIHGIAIFQPRAALAFGKIATARAMQKTGTRMRTPAVEDEAELVEAFRAAFVETIEYCGWPRETFESESERNVREFFTAKRGAISAAARVAIDERNAIIGAALIRDSNIADAAMLDVLFVLPSWQRRGLGAAMCADALRELAAEGKRWLITTWHLGNEPSAAWHRKFGFVEEPDLSNAQLYRRAAKQELHRLERLGPWDEQCAAALRGEVAKWEREIERLDALLVAGDEAGAFASERFR